MQVIINNLRTYPYFFVDKFFLCQHIELKLGVDPKVLKFDKVHMRTHRHSGLLISNFALEKLFRYLINCAGGDSTKSISMKSRFLSHSH